MVFHPDAAFDQFRSKRQAALVKLEKHSLNAPETRRLRARPARPA